MKVTTRQTNIPLWHYICPECNFGNAETGYHAPLHMIYCEVCLEDNRQVKLKRWPAEQDSSAAPGSALPGSRLPG